MKQTEIALEKIRYDSTGSIIEMGPYETNSLDKTISILEKP